MRSALARTLRAARAIALPLITAAREANVPTAYGIRRVSPVVTKTSSIGTPSSWATIWANDGLVALALRGQAGRHVDPPARLDLDVAALVGADAGALDVAADARARPAAPRPRPASR